MTASLPPAKQWRYKRLLSEHAFDKLRTIDCTFAESEAALGEARVLERQHVGDGEIKDLLLVRGWKRPLHVVVVVDEARREERVVTI